MKHFLISLWNLHHKTALILIAIFFISILIGIAAPDSFQYLMVQSFFEKVQELDSPNSFVLAQNIFWNNVFVSFLLVISFFTLIVPSLLIGMNGMVIGIFLLFTSRMAELQDIPYHLLIINSILPHGIFELPAILIAAAFGTNLGLKLYMKNRFFTEDTFQSLFKKVIQGMIFFVIPFLILAASIEVFVTPLLMERTLKLSASKTDPSLEPLFLDPKTINATEMAMEEISKPPSFALLFSDAHFKELKAVYPKVSSQKRFSLGENGKLSIAISEHKNNEEAEKFANLLREDDIFDTELMESPKKESKEYEKTVITEGKYAVFFIFETKDKALNDEIQEKQREKLKKY